MTEIRDTAESNATFRQHVGVAALVILLSFVLLIARLYYLQVISYETFSEQAEDNRTAAVPIVPMRGLIYDRNGVLLANNYSAFSLEILPVRVENLEQVIEKLSFIINIDEKDKKKFLQNKNETRGLEFVPIRNRLTPEEMAKFSAYQFMFPGIQIKERAYREYPLKETGSHIIGYLGRINQTDKEKLAENEDIQANYRGTDQIGKQGIEQSYEYILHGQTGIEAIEKSASGRATRRLGGTPATAGQSLTLTVDIKLQQMIEQMFGDRRGALVALDPRNGEILALVSKPTYDPNLFIGGIDTQSWQELNESIDKPLLNRALRGTYPPGSTYKPFMAMAALQTNSRSSTQIVHDSGSFHFGGNEFRGHAVGSVDMVGSIVHSSNVYYYSLARDMGVEKIHDFMSPLGFGSLTGIDLMGEMKGVLPNEEWKRNTFKKPEQQKWFAGETISLGIGQGYNNFTMLQLATATATLANGGLKYTPHLVKTAQKPLEKQAYPIPQPPAVNLNFKSEHTDIIRRGLVGVTKSGTAARAFAGAVYTSAGKTGTAQAVGIKQNQKYSKSRLPEHLRDHSLYMAFAPAQDPVIALAVIVENAGFGAEHAAPIARRIFDYWLLGQYPNETDMTALRQGNANAPIGKPLNAAEVPIVTSTPIPLNTTPSVTDVLMK